MKHHTTHTAGRKAGREAAAITVHAELENLAQSVTAMKRNLHAMNASLEESRRKLPLANRQLDQLSAQTEAVAQHMLDMVEQIVDHQETIGRLSAEVTAFVKRSQVGDRDIICDKAMRVMEMAAISQRNAFLIMDALQFQNVAVQQMHQASELLDEIEHRLQHLHALITGSERPAQDEPAMVDEAVVDAPDLLEPADQTEVDHIVDEVTETVAAGRQD
jgi:chromosome segregation ATPase